MKNLFSSGVVLSAFMLFYTQGASPAITEWVETGQLSPRSARQLTEQFIYTILISCARYCGDETVYTPKYLPGRDKEDVLWK